MTAVVIAAGSTTLHGTLDDIPAGRDFTALLPLTVLIRDFHATEKIGELPRSLTTCGATGIEPSAGDISYYAPWGNLALFYRDFAGSEGLVTLGRLDPDGVGLLATLPDDTTVTVALNEGPRS